MAQNIKIISLPLPFKMGSVNCYLMEIDTSFILIDTGSSNMRHELEQALENADCRPGNLNLIVITHGDFDHTGNAVYLREKFGAKITMHADDLAMAKHGDMLSNRKRTNLINRVIAFLIPRLMRYGESKDSRLISSSKRGKSFLNTASMLMYFQFQDTPKVRLAS